MRAAVWLVWLAAWGWPAAQGCGPGRGAGRRRDPRKLTPLVFSQHEPNVYEQHDSAAGKSEGRVARNDSRFQDLQPNYNPDILFRDEEGTGADRFMTQRCKEKLNTLAISVMNQWPGVRLRVTEGWEEERHMQRESELHYEGRAVDVTTSDRDKSKYGMLARLAVEAGFDWVYYETRAHIHCSVKSESSQAARTGGCFPASSVVRLEDGRTLSLAEVRPGHMVLAQDSSGKLVYSEVLTFLDRDENAKRLFVRVKMENNATVTATEAHLLLLASGQVTFAGTVRIGDELMVPGSQGATAARRVVSIDRVRLEGVYAPLTRAGTLVVDGAVASCYAAVDSDRLAHAALMPLRAWLGVASLMRSNPSLTVGVHPYVKALYSIGRYLLPSDMFYD